MVNFATTVWFSDIDEKRIYVYVTITNGNFMFTIDEVVIGNLFFSANKIIGNMDVPIVIRLLPVLQLR